MRMTNHTTQIRPWRDTLEFAIIAVVIVLTAVSAQTVFHETAHAQIYECMDAAMSP